MSTSNSGMEFLRRHGLRYTTVRRRPVLDLSQLLVTKVPVAPHELNPHVMLDTQGDPPPDRSGTDLWLPEAQD